MWLFELVCYRKKSIQKYFQKFSMLQNAGILVNSNREDANTAAELFIICRCCINTAVRIKHLNTYHLEHCIRPVRAAVTSSAGLKNSNRGIHEEASLRLTQ